MGKSVHARTLAQQLVKGISLRKNQRLFMSSPREPSLIVKQGKALQKPFLIKEMMKILLTGHARHQTGITQQQNHKILRASVR